jgi:hypothetical protein
MAAAAAAAGQAAAVGVNTLSTHAQHGGSHHISGLTDPIPWQHGRSDSKTTIQVRWGTQQAALGRTSGGQRDPGVGGRRRRAVGACCSQPQGLT